jgi:selenocysteine lyase/cysteine desulfurase
LVLTADNHNSVNGLRVPAVRRRAAVDYVPLTSDLRGLDPRRYLPSVSEPSLFAYPAQSNFSGVHHPLEWIAMARRRGYRVLLDAAAYAPTNPLSLAQSRADFVALSFYKLFGYPTGVGALVAKREALALLRRRYFGGGTVQFVSVQNRLLRYKAGSEAFEDGTPNFLAMPAICDGLRWLQQLDLRRVQARVRSMTSALLTGLAEFGDAIRVYGPRDTQSRGGTIAFNVCGNGKLLPFEVVETRARDCGIAIRGGCFCNPGAAEFAFGIPARKARRCLRGQFTIPRFRSCLKGAPVGAVRASIGVATSARDVERLLELVRELSG